MAERDERPRVGVHVARSAAYFCVAFLVIVKALVANDLDATLEEDPIDLWTALGVAMLLVRAGVREWEQW